MKTMILSCIAIALAMFFTVGQLPQVDDKVYGYGYYDDVLTYNVKGKDNFVILWDTNYDYEYIYTDAPYGTEIQTVIMGSKYYTYIDTSGVEIGYDPIYLSAVTFEGYWIEIEIYNYYGYNSYPLSPPATSQAPPSATDPAPSMTVTNPCYTTGTPVTTTNIPASTTTTWRPSCGDPNDDPPASTTVTKATTHNTSVSMSGAATTTTSVPSDSVTSFETTSKYYPILDNMAVGSVKVCNQYGDLNDDNMINLTDLTILSLYLLGDCELNESELYAANVEQYEDDSSAPDIADLAKLKQYILKQNVILGPEEIIIIYR